MSRVLERVPPGMSEKDIARRWWSLPIGCVLPLIGGGRYRLLCTGSPGGPAGPDVRDAVLRSLTPPAMGTSDGEGHTAGDQVGNVEFHIRASDWGMHGHSSDPRYNHVILHVVLLYDDAPALRQDGVVVPTCSLYDLPGEIPVQDVQVWPCQGVFAALSQEERDKILSRAGLQRFEQKAQDFVLQLHAANESELPGGWELYERCLLPALAESLAYGRDREFFRAVGYRLLGRAEAVPEPLGRAPQPAPLDADRLRCLALLARQSRRGELWRNWRALLASSHDTADTLQQLRATLINTGLSLARSDIILCNVVLPFAAAVALVEDDARLFERARTLYRKHPGLPSNHVTRMMARQLQLSQEPRGSCCQQGLHDIYQQSCREKRCATCIAGKWDL